MTDAPTMPMFVFHRRRDVELEAGFILAGQLIVDIPKKGNMTKLKRRDQRMVNEIIQKLTDECRSGRMSADALIYGWQGGVRPANAVDTSNEEIMTAWVKRSIVIGVRVDPRNDGLMRVDSDQMRQMGLKPRV
jgi:hypothetical protein